MRPDEIVRRLNLARIEAGQLITAPGRVTTVDSPEFISWSMRVGSLLIHSLGSNHHITKRFLHNQRLLPPLPEGHNQQSDYADEFNKGILMARAILHGAIAEFDVLAAELSLADRSTVSARLWERIGCHVQTEAWSMVAQQTVIFTQDRMREWVGFPEPEPGPDSADPMFGDHSDLDAIVCDYRQHEQGWQFLAEAIAQAKRDIDGHQPVVHSDQGSARSIVGACLLLLGVLHDGYRSRSSGWPATSRDLCLIEADSTTASIHVDGRD